MSNFVLQQQSHHYSQFRCLQAACEDTCCSGWRISVDQETYEHYQRNSHPVLGPQLRQWIQKEPLAQPQKNNFAQIVLSQSACPFLEEKLCSVQTALGESSLSHSCAVFPRIINQVNGVREKSLDLSCPEAARLLLTDPGPACFEQVEAQEEERHSSLKSTRHPHPYFWEIRSALLTLLQNRHYPVAGRLILVGHVCEKLSELAGSGQDASTLELLEGFTVGIDAGLYDAHLQNCSAEAATQLSVALELMTERIRLDYVSPRYLDLYNGLIRGLQLTPGQSREEAGGRYARAYTLQYAPFMAKHEYMLEHYLVYYAYRHLFPFGAREGDAQNQADQFTTQYLLMAAFFAMLQTTLIGLSADGGAAFQATDVVRCIQVFSKNVEHCASYPPRVLAILAAHGINTVQSMSMLTQLPQHRG